MSQLARSSAMLDNVPDFAVSLELTGVPQARLGDQRLPLSGPDALMLAWLALEGPTPRERMAALLWPHSDAEAARNALRQRLFRLRKQLGVELIQAAGTDAALLHLAPHVSHDLALGSPLLGQLDAADLPELQTWLTARRASQQAQSRQETEARIESLEASGQFAAALPLALALLQAHPLSEDAHRRVMRLHYLRGDRAAALLAFDACEQMLKHEVGARPSAATLALLQTIDGAGATGTSTDAASAAAGAPAPGALPASVLRPPRLVGRASALANLQRGLAAGHVVVLMGEAGMGKSRLLQSLAGEQPGLLHVSGRPGDTLVPYATLARTLRKLLLRVPAAAQDSLRQALSPLLPELWPTPTTAAAVASSSSATPSPNTSPNPAPTPARQTLSAPVRRLLQHAAAQVPIVALDDLHFADDATLDLLQSLLATPREGGQSAMRWCLGLRPPAPGSRLEGLLNALASAAPHTRLLLKPLSETEMAELIDSLSLPGVQGPAMAARLHARTGGNPLFALETLKLAWHEGQLTRAAEMPQPDSLAQLITQQLSRLSASALQLARVAAVAGVGFSIPLAENLLGRSALELADAWAELEAQQVLRGDSFAHDLVHDAVLSSLPAVIARHLHGQAAAWLEQQGAEPAHIAAHWEAAGQPLRALPALRAAAEHARRAWREGERIAFLVRAADIAEKAKQPEQAFELLRHAVEAHMDTVRQADGLPLLERLQSLASTALQQAYVAGDRAWYSTVMGDYALAVEQGELALSKALALAPEQRDEALLAAIRQRLGTGLSLLGRFDEALAHMQAAAPTIEAHATPDAVGEFHGNLAVVLVNLGRPAQAQPHHERALALSLRQGDQAQHATHLANAATSRLDAGDVQGANALMVQAQRIVTSFELEGSSAGFIALLQAQCDRALGRYSAALAGCEHAATVLAERNPARVPVAHLQLAQVWLDLGQHARALQLLGSSGSAHAAQQMQARYSVRWCLLQARLQRRLQGSQGGGSAQTVAATLAQAQTLLPAVGWPELRLLVLTEQALALPSSRALAQLQDVAQQARALGLHGAELGALLQACTVTTAPKASATLAHAALNLSAHVEALHTDRALRWWAPAQALVRAGDLPGAQQLAQAGQAWLRDTAAQQIAPEFVHGFLHQHPLHAALLGWQGKPQA
jgi:DNA-binding SARP family transcriptional activator/tetratricopeptide (TPR) repeat protein